MQSHYILHIEQIWCQLGIKLIKTDVNWPQPLKNQKTVSQLQACSH